LKQGNKWVIGNAVSKLVPNHKGAVVTMVERKSRYGLITKVTNKTSESWSAQPLWTSLKLWLQGGKTLTFDNGREFAGHAHIYEQLQSTTYFARPFASLE
jgi:IS30 family transposase